MTGRSVVLHLDAFYRSEDEWLLGRVCYWPDVARSQPEYNRPNWHYQLGSCLVLGKCEVPSCSCDCPDNATLATKELHIGQAWESVNKLETAAICNEIAKAIATYVPPLNRNPHVRPWWSPEGNNQGPSQNR